MRVVVRSGSRRVDSVVTFTAVLMAAMLRLTMYSLGNAEWIAMRPV